MIGILISLGITLVFTFIVLWLKNKSENKSSSNNSPYEVEAHIYLKDPTRSEAISEKPQTLENTKSSRDILDGIDIDTYVDFIAKKLLYSEYGYHLDSSLKSLESFDPLLEEAARLIVVHQQGSTSLIQRKFSIGYNRAGRLMDQLESIGVVGPSIDSNYRVVYIMDEYYLEQNLKSLRVLSTKQDDQILDVIEEQYYERIQLRKEYLLQSIKQEEELLRLQKEDEEREEIRLKILEKERKKKLEKEIRQQMIDNGEIES